MGTITEHTKKATKIESNNATGTMARKKKTMEKTQTRTRTDNLTNTSNNKISDTNTKEGNKSKGQKKLLKARNDIESAYKSNHSPSHHKATPFVATPHQRLQLQTPGR